MLGNPTPSVLITGGAGFIGSHLCRYYIERDWRVLCLDNFSTGSRENIQDLLTNPNFELIEQDIIKPFEANPCLILNFACPASPVQYQLNAVQTIKTNVLGTLNMLELARKTGARILQASTSEIYGDPEVHPQAEEYRGNVNPIGIRSCYDEGKRLSETLCFDYHRSYDVDIRVVRIFNTYGPRMAIDDGRVVSNFVVQALTNKNLTIYGDGKQTRSFCYIDYLVRGIYKFSQTASFIGPINLGSDMEISIAQLAAEVKTLTNSASKIVHMASTSDDPHIRCPDIQKAKHYLQWQPTVHLSDGLQKTIAYFQGKLEKTLLNINTIDHFKVADHKHFK